MLNLMNKRHVTRPHKREVTGVEVRGQIPLLEHREFAPGNKQWVLWLSYNRNQDAGTYLIMYRDGSIVLETLYPTGEVSVLPIKPKEK